MQLLILVSFLLKNRGSLFSEEAKGMVLANLVCLLCDPYCFVLSSYML